MQETHFVIYSDHQALRWLIEINDLSDRLMRWRLQLAELYYEDRFKKSICNAQGYCMSRLDSDAIAEA